MDRKLFVQAISKVTCGFVAVASAIFVSAGSLWFLKGWVFLGALFVPMISAGIVMMLKSPHLLKKRLYAKEEQKKQSFAVKLSGIMFLAGFIVAGFDFRFGWYNLHRVVVICALVIFFAGYILYAEVLRENPYLSRTITLQENQRVIKSGLYSVVRHPMYTATILMFLTIPLILGSLYSFLIFLAYPFILAMRIKNEEEFLEKELPGYREYKDKVKYRLIPFVW